MATGKEPTKNEGEWPIPTLWRAVFVQIVDRLVAGDYRLEKRPARIAPIMPDQAKFIAEQIALYGDELIALTDETWKSSIYSWVDGHWEVLVDLCTKEQGVSDLVLFIQVREQDEGFLFEIISVYVP